MAGRRVPGPAPPSGALGLPAGLPTLELTPEGLRGRIASMFGFARTGYCGTQDAAVRAAPSVGFGPTD